MKYWYLIYTKPNQEEVAKQHLERQAYEVYLPMSLSRRKKRGKVMKLIDVMFPRYLFIHLDDTSEDWGPIRSTIGVSTLVHFGSSPAKIPEKLITALKSRENNEGVHDLLARTFKEGEKVLISEGLFEGYEGVLTSTDSQERVTLLLKIAENLVKVQLKQDVIEPSS